MRRQILSSPREIAPNMTALVDVVMVILIFLMLAGTFASNSHFLKSKSGIVVPPISVAPSDSVNVDLFLVASRDGSPTVHAGDITTNDTAKLTIELTRQLHAYEQAGTPPAKIQVILHPTGKVHYGHLIAVYQAVLQSGYTRVAFAKTNRT